MLETIRKSIWIEKIEAFASSRNLSIRKAAVLLGFSNVYLSKVINDQEKPSPLLKAKLLAVEGCEFDSENLKHLINDDVMNFISNKETMADFVKKCNEASEAQALKLKTTQNIDWAALIRECASYNNVKIPGLAKLLGVTRSYVYDVVDGRRPASPLLKAKLIELMNMELTPQLIQEIMPDDAAEVMGTLLSKVKLISK